MDTACIIFTYVKLYIFAIMYVVSNNLRIHT